jgi:adenine phosphoribosyltransferase
MDLRPLIRDVPDFPKPGILFRDITPLLHDARALDYTMSALAEPFQGRGITTVAAIESRGFIFGSSVAQRLGAGFVPIRKPGKLPWTKKRNEYVLEYGTDALEIHDDAVAAGEQVLLVDDVLATGGTAAAATQLLRDCGATISGAAFLIELDFLEGRRKLDGIVVEALIHY